MRGVVLATVFAVWGVATASAEAQPWSGSEQKQDVTVPAMQLRPSMHLGHGGGADKSKLVGLGLDLIHKPTKYPFHVGSFARATGEMDDGWRMAGGLRGGFSGFAAELGVAHRTEARGFAASTGIHLGKQYIWGPLGVGTYMTIPVRNYQPAQGAALRTQGFELGFLMSLGWSLNVRGNRPQWGCHGWHGRKGGGGN